MNIDLIRPYQKNAKAHPQKQVDQIAASIQAFGFNQPVVVDKDGVIIVGHGRFEAAKQLGMTDVPAVVVDLNEEQAKAYRLADNKLNESDWDMGLVVEELKGLSMEMIDLTGFDRDLVLDDDEKDDFIPEGVPPQTVKGDLYELGSHRVICGDATDLSTVQLLMGGVQADMVFTDPPYNVDYKGKGEKTSNGIMNDAMATNDFSDFLSKVFKNYVAVTKKGAGYYVFHASRTQSQFEDAMAAAGMEIKNQLIWNKPVAAMGWGDYRWKHEPFFYACAVGGNPQFFGDRTHSTIWDFQKSEQQLLAWAKKMKAAERDGKTTVWSMKRDSVAEYVHPTQKPVELVQYALSNSSKAGDVVLDLFGGSGSVLIACSKTGRTSYTLELDPKYVDTIVQRWVDYTGVEEIKKNGQTITWPKNREE